MDAFFTRSIIEPKGYYILGGINMIVYVLTCMGHWYANDCNDWENIIGIYDSNEKAENIKAKLEKEYEEDPYCVPADEATYMIYEFTVE